MPKKRFGAEQIVTLLRQIEVLMAQGKSAPDACRDAAISPSGGIDLKAIAEIAGHASIHTTVMYVEANPKRLARIPQEVTL